MNDSKITELQGEVDRLRSMVAELAVTQGEIANMLSRLCTLLVSQDRSIAVGGVFPRYRASLIGEEEQAHKIGAAALAIASKALSDDG